MPFDIYDFENITEERRKSVAQTIRPVSVEEIKKIGQQLFKFAEDPSRDALLQFLAEHPGASYYHAVASDGVNAIYCPDKDKGLWFLPGTGLGPLQASGRRIMKEAIAGHK